VEGVYNRFSDFLDDSFYKNTGIVGGTSDVNLKEISE